MAELSSLRRVIRCTECQQLFTEPKELQCLHTFCLRCLEGILSRSQDQQNLECPTCHRLTELPDRDVSRLQSSIYTNCILGAARKMKSDSLLPAAMPPMDRHQQQGEFPFCPLHESNQLELLCTNCKETICFQCTIKGNAHHDHEYTHIEDLLGESKEEMDPLLKPLNTKIADSERELAKVNTRCKEVFTKREELECSINTYFDEVERILNARRIALIAKLHLEMREKVNTLASEKARREIIHAQLCGSADILNEALAAENNLEVVEAKGQIINLINVALEDSVTKPDHILANTEISIEVSLPQEIKHSFEKIGEIRTPDPFSCIVSGSGLKIAEMNQTSVVTLAVNTRKGEPYCELIPSLETEFISSVGEDTVCEFKKREFNITKIHFTPRRRGKNFLHIKINKKHVKGSPFPITVRLPVKSLGVPVTVVKVARPWGVTTTKSGDVIVSEYHNVNVYDSTWRKKYTLAGGRDTPFRYPCGVTTDDAGNMYIADTGNHRIQKFSATGQYIKSIGKKGDGARCFIDPKDLSWNPVNRKVYIADSPRVQVLTSDLQFCDPIGVKILVNAFGVACDSDGSIFVSDNKNKNIRKFSHNGQLVTTFTNSLNPGGIPLTIAVDTCGFLYVNDEATNKIFVLDSTGRYVSSFGGAGSREGMFNKPRVIAVDEGGRVHVCDNANGRLQVF